MRFVPGLQSDTPASGTHGIGPLRYHDQPRSRVVLACSAMADETTRDTLLCRVKEQGEIVRRLKAAKADNTQVRGLADYPSPFRPSWGDSLRPCEVPPPCHRCTTFLLVAFGGGSIPVVVLNYTLSSCHLDFSFGSKVVPLALFTLNIYFKHLLLASHLASRFLGLRFGLNFCHRCRQISWFRLLFFHARLSLRSKAWKRCNRFLFFERRKCAVEANESFVTMNMMQQASLESAM